MSRVNSRKDNKPVLVPLRQQKSKRGPDEHNDYSINNDDNNNNNNKSDNNASTKSSPIQGTGNLKIRKREWSINK
jgi:hypothetical protein